MQDPESSPWGLIGVAPEATLGMYRVFGCFGEAPLDILAAAFLQAAADKANIVSLSAGIRLQWEEDDPFSIITANLEAQGVAVVVANGNYGRAEINPSAPAIGKSVIAVGSAQNSHFPVVYVMKDSRGRSLKYSGDPWPVSAPKTGLTVYDYTKIAADAESPVGCSWDGYDMAVAAVPDKDNAILAFPYGGGCTWGSKISVAQSVGFKYVLVYAVDGGDIFDQDYNALDPIPPNYGKLLGCRTFDN